MARESLKSKKARAAEISKLLSQKYPKTESLLEWHDDPFKLVIAVSLSAQTTDAAVNKITPILWQKYKGAADLAKASEKNLQQILKPIGFYKNKAKNTIKCAKMIVSDFSGYVPDNMDDLQKLPGVGRKTANIVMNIAFGQAQGIAVDTHVFRITHLLKLSNAQTPDKTEKDLLNIFDKSSWSDINHQLVLYGREVCVANRPKCDLCCISKYCPSCKY